MSHLNELFGSEVAHPLSFDAAAPQLLTKSNIQSFAEKFIESINEGYGNPLESAAIINGLESALKLIKDGIRSTVLDELKEGGKGSFHGVKIETMEAGGRYDYTKCGDVVYDALKVESDELKWKLDEREKFLKAIPNAGMLITDTATGETWFSYPPAKPASTTNYKVTIPK